MQSHRSFLMLQGPQSRFFKRLGSALENQGHRVTKINFCGGDVLSWYGRNTRVFNKPFFMWQDHVAGLMNELAITDVLLFGDRRAIHAEAIAEARRRGVRVYVFEEGYLQPNCITFEEHGVNANSPLPRTADGIRLLGASLEAIPDVPVIPNSLKVRVMDTIRHHVGNVCLWSLFPFYRTHRPYVIGRELMGWLPRYLNRKGRVEKAERMQETIFNEDLSYFLYPLQLDSDFQMRLNSSFTDVPDAIRHVLISFAGSAPKQVRLVIKNHPLDNGLIDYESFVGQLIDELGIADRVVYLDGGNGKRLLERCRGVVVVNSSMGLEGLLAGRPVYCLGQALYGVPGLAVTPQELSLNGFWNDPYQADPELLELFVRVVFHHALVRGNFYTEQGIATAVEGVLERLALKAPAQYEEA